MACGLCTQTFNLFQRTRYQCPSCNDVVCRNCSSSAATLKGQPRHERRVCQRCTGHDHRPEICIADIEPTRPAMQKPPRLQLDQPHDVKQFLSAGGLQLRRPVTPRPSPSIDPDTLDFNWVHPFPKAPVPDNDSARAATVDRLRLDVHLPALVKDTTLTILLEKAMAATDTTMATLHIVDASHAYVVSSTGSISPSKGKLGKGKVPRLEALASHVVATGEPLVVFDSAIDMRFRAHPVATECHVTGLLSIPLWMDRHVIGTMDLWSAAPLDATNDGLTSKTMGELATLANLATGFIQNTCETTRLSDSENGLRPRRKTAPAKIESAESMVETMEALLCQSMRTCTYVQGMTK